MASPQGNSRSPFSRALKICSPGKQTETAIRLRFVAQQLFRSRSGPVLLFPIEITGNTEKNNPQTGERLDWWREDRVQGPAAPDQNINRRQPRVSRTTIAARNFRLRPPQNEECDDRECVRKNHTEDRKSVEVVVMAAQCQDGSPNALADQAESGSAPFRMDDRHAAKENAVLRHGKINPRS